MLEAFKRNIQSVQAGISTGLQRLSINDESTGISSDSNVNLSAGATLYQVYNKHWETLHLEAENNFLLAEKLDKDISSFVHECESQHHMMVEIHSLLAHLPNIMSQLHDLLATIGSLQGLFHDVEKELIFLEDLSEELNMQEEKLDLRVDFALQREKNTLKLDQVKNSLLSNHAEKMKVLDELNETKRKEKEIKYHDRFLFDMECYQRGGAIKRVDSPSDGTEAAKLEDVAIEDEEDNASLTAFLEEP